MSPAGIEVHEVCKRFDAFVALDTVSLTVADGSFTVLLGPSGSGKTTLLSIIGGFTQADGGSVSIDGKDMGGLGPARRPTSTVFQDYALFPHMTLAENVGFGLRMRGIDRKRRHDRAGEMLDLVGLAGLGTNKPHELSGGQRQRVALARSLAVEPKVLLLDEPLGALDLKLRRQMQAELKRLQRDVGTTFVHVTHDQEEAMAIADRIVVMNKGRIEDDGEAARVYLRPRSRFTADFMGQSSFLPGRIAAIKDGCLSVETPAGRLRVFQDDAAFHEGDTVTVSLRPEHIELMDAPGRQTLGAAEIVSLFFVGPFVQAEMRLVGTDTITIVALLPQTSQARLGERLALFVGLETPVVMKD